MWRIGRQVGGPSVGLGTEGLEEKGCGPPVNPLGSMIFFLFSSIVQQKTELWSLWMHNTQCSFVRSLDRHLFPGCCFKHLPTLTLRSTKASEPVTPNGHLVPLVNNAISKHTSPMMLVPVHIVSPSSSCQSLQQR